MQADGGRTDTKRHTNEFTADELLEGDRIDPKLVAPLGHDIEDDPTRTYQRANGHPGYQLRTIIETTGGHNDVQSAILFDPDTETFVRVSGHTSSAAWSQKERDWKVRGLGTSVALDSLLELEYGPDDANRYDDEEYVAEWLDILFGNAAYGDDITDEVEQFKGTTVTVRDYDGRRAEATITLEDE